MRVACVTGGDLGHLGPVAALAVGLRRAGADVIVVSGGPHYEALAGDGVEVAELPMPADAARHDDFGYLLWERQAGMAPAVADVLSPWRPELVVADTLTTVGAFAAGLLRAPWLEVVPHHLMDPSPHLPPVGLGRAPSCLPWRRWSDASIRRQQGRSLEQAASARRRARLGLGLEGDGRPAARLLCTLPGLEPARPDWPADAFVVGPLEWEPPFPELELPPGDGPLVIVSDSTATGADRSLADEAGAALADHGDLRVVLTTARAPAVRPPRMVIGRGKHGPLLDQAALAVGTAGGGYVGKALSRGIPMVLVPLHGDQLETAARVRRAGAAEVVRLRDLRAHRLERAIRRVLHEPAYRQAASALASGAARVRGRAVALVRDIHHARA